MKFIGSILALLLLCIAVLGEPTSRTTGSGFPLGYQDNPFDYKYGRVTAVDMPTQNGKVITNFTFSPVGTYEMFTEQVALCGDQRHLLDFSQSDVLVITMTHRMTRRYCHDLVRIDIITGARAAGSARPLNE